jgi:hypothetical protein
MNRPKHSFTCVVNTLKHLSWCPTQHELPCLASEAFDEERLDYESLLEFVHLLLPTVIFAHLETA